MSPVGGWNQRIPRGVERCTCRARRLQWAQLSPVARDPCCGLPCCLAPHAAIVSTRDDILRLRALSLRADWRCPRCGQPIAHHQRNYECLDEGTRAIRALRVRFGRSRSGGAQPNRSR